jgi:hypothetical protein
MLSPKGRGGFIQNVTWRRITADESGGLLWLQVSNESVIPVRNSRVRLRLSRACLVKSSPTRYRET